MQCRSWPFCPSFSLLANLPARVHLLPFYIHSINTCLSSLLSPAQEALYELRLTRPAYRVKCHACHAGGDFEHPPPTPPPSNLPTFSPLTAPLAPRFFSFARAAFQMTGYTLLLINCLGPCVLAGIAVMVLLVPVSEAFGRQCFADGRPFTAIVVEIGCCSCGLRATEQTCYYVAGDRSCADGSYEGVFYVVQAPGYRVLRFDEGRLTDYHVVVYSFSEERIVDMLYVFCITT